MNDWTYLTFGDLVYCGGAVLGVRMETLLVVLDRSAAASAVEVPGTSIGGVELFPEAHDKAAAMFCRMILAPPFPVASEQLALVFVDLFLARNGLRWTYGIEAGDWILKIREGVVGEHSVALWMKTGIEGVEDR